MVCGLAFCAHLVFAKTTRAECRDARSLRGRQALRRTSVAPLLAEGGRGWRREAKRTALRRPRTTKWVKLCAAEDGDDGKAVAAVATSAVDKAREAAPVAESAALSSVKGNGSAKEEKTGGEVSMSGSADDGSMFRFELGSIPVAFPRRWLVYMVPFLWGTFNPALRLLYNLEHPPDPAFFNSARMVLSSLTYIPFMAIEISMLLRARRQQSEAGTDAQSDSDAFLWLRGGSMLGVYVFFATFCQVIGLESTSAGRAAFLNQLQTVGVPLIGVALGRESITKATAFCSVLAVAGVALLSTDKGGAHAVQSITGDLWEIASAFFFSLYVSELGQYASKCKTTLLVGTKVVVQMLLSVSWSVYANWSSVVNLGAFELQQSQNELIVTALVIAWTGLMVSAFSGVVLTAGQKATPASEVAIILATQPLWAAALSALILGERFGPNGAAGAALILGATAVSSRAKASAKASKK